MALSIRPIHPGFAGEVSGVDITQPFSRDEVAAIRRHGPPRVLVFRDQRLTDERSARSPATSATLEASPGGNITKPAERRLPLDMQDVSNLDKDQGRWRATTGGGCTTWATGCGTPTARTARCRRIFAAVRAHRGDQGGHTEFADMRAAYDALDDATKARDRRLVCEHSLMFSRGALGFTELPRRSGRCQSGAPAPGAHASGDRTEVAVPVVATGSIVGWPVPEARAFLRDLVEHATQPRFVYSHKWRQWDLVMWDNRQTMHRVTRFDETQVRDMRRTTVGGDAMTVAQAA